MKSLLHSAWNLLLYACLGTLISLGIIAVHLRSSWDVDGTRWGQAIDVMRGASAAGEHGGKAPAAQPAAELPSYEQILEVRALKSRDLELRERQLQNNLAQLHHEENNLAEAEKGFRRIREHFNEQLAAVQEKSTSAGLDEVRRTLESIDTKQAKQLLLEMLDKKEMDDVVSLLIPMSDSKRAKIIGEFTPGEELEKISEVLRQIREGRPESQISETTKKQLKE
jgi:vacuolar-type H+-ATPase subunit H